MAKSFGTTLLMAMLVSIGLTSFGEQAPQTLVVEEYRVPPRFSYFGDRSLGTPVSQGAYSPSATATYLATSGRWIVRETPERQAAIREFVEMAWRHYKNNPKQFGTPPAPDPNLVTVRLRANGTILIGRKRIKATALHDELAKLAAKNPQPPTTITCDDGAGPATHIYKACEVVGLKSLLIRFDE